MTGVEIAEAFNTANTRTNWRARAVTLKNRDTVHFEDRTGLIHLVYDCSTGEFMVSFKAAVASFGDYANAIARALLTVLTSLQAAGLAFVAPAGLEGMEIVIKHGGIGNQVSVRYTALAVYEHKAYGMRSDGTLGEINADNPAIDDRGDWMNHSAGEELL